MNNKQQNKLSMYERIYAMLVTNALIVALSAPLVAAQAAFFAIINAIHAADTVKQTSSKGMTVSKSAERTALAKAAQRIASAVMAYASDTDDPTLYEQVNYPPSTIQRLPDEILPEVAQLIRDAAHAVIGSLGPYNVVAGDLVDLLAKRQAFIDATPLETNAVAVKKTNTSLLLQLFGNGDILLKKTMDKLVRTFSVTNPDFVSNYFNARVIYDLGMHHSGGAHPSFYVIIKDGASGLFCKGAIVTFGSQPPVVTGANGAAHIKAADATEQSIRVKFGYKTVTVAVFDPTSGNITVDMALGAYMSSTFDSLIPGFSPAILFAGAGAHNCVLRSDGIITVDNGSGSITYRSQIDHLDYVATINYATGEITTPAGAPPDGTIIYRPTT